MALKPNPSQKICNECFRFGGHSWMCSKRQSRVEDTADDLGSLYEAIKEWWKEHKHDTCGGRDEWNVYDTEPDFITKAKGVFGDWEKT